MNRQTRFIDYNELNIELRYLDNLGINVPELKRSRYETKYLMTKDNGIEVYKNGDRIIEVGIGSVIDNHGNVVELYSLEKKIYELKQNSQDIKKNDRVSVLLSL